MKTTFSQDIIQAVDDDQIEVVYIPEFRSYLGENTKFHPANSITNKYVPYPIALALLNYQYDPGFGGMDCHDIVMWSKTKVYYIHEYDGSTSITYVPRHPTSTTPY